MSKNMSRYYQAWELRQQGNTFKEIGDIMNVSKNWANFLVHFIDFKIKYKKSTSKELNNLIEKYL